MGGNEYISYIRFLKTLGRLGLIEPIHNFLMMGEAGKLYGEKL